MPAQIFRLTCKIVRSKALYVVHFYRVTSVLVCENSVCARIGYELFMISERTSGITDEKATLCTTGRRMLYIGESWLHEQLTFFSVIYANFGADPPLRESQEVISMRSHLSG